MWAKGSSVRKNQRQGILIKGREFLSWLERRPFDVYTENMLYSVEIYFLNLHRVYAFTLFPIILHVCREY